MLQTKLFNIEFLDDITNKYGTPCYVYSQELISNAFMSYKNAFKNRNSMVCYAVKANDNLYVLNILNKLGAGFDIVSVGELRKLLAINVDPNKIVFSGVGKSRDDVIFGIKNGVHMFNIESVSELEMINNIGIEMNKCIDVGFRVNPNINAETHPYISTGLHENKFGVSIKDVLSISDDISNGKYTGVNVVGLGFHIGSQLMNIQPILDSIKCMFNVIDRFKNIKHIDIGGGLGINYNVAPFNINPKTGLIHGNLSPTQMYNIFNENLYKRIFKFINAVVTLIDTYQNGKYKHLKIMCEPGRSIIGHNGILLSKTILTKNNGSKNFIILDCSMTELIRPCLYSANHPIIPLMSSKIYSNNSGTILADFVGPVCESADFLGKNRRISSNIKSGINVAILNAGAYGYVMSSNYNGRVKPTQLMLDNDNKIIVINKRENLNDIINHELNLIRSRL